MFSERRMRWLGVALLCVSSVAITLAAMMHSPAPPPPAGQWVTVQAQPIERHLRLTGHVQAARTSTLAAPFDGVLRTVAATPGQRVNRDQVLAELDTAEVDVQWRRAQGELLQARTALRTLQDWSTGPEVARARRQLASAQRSLRTSEASVADARQLLARGIVARLEVDTLIEQARAQRLALAEAQDEWQQVQAQGQGTPVRLAEMAVANAQAQYAAVDTLRERRHVRAPHAGVVVLPPAASDDGRAHIAQPGQRVTQGMALLSLVDLEQPLVVTQVHEADVPALQLRMPVRLVIGALANLTVSGQIETVASQARGEPGEVAWFDVSVALDDAPAALASGLRVGMSVELDIRLAQPHEGWVIPFEALKGDRRSGFEVRYRAAVAAPEQPRAVSVGQALPAGIEVLGLDAGEVWVPDEG